MEQSTVAARLLQSLAGWCLASLLNV